MTVAVRTLAALERVRMKHPFTASGEIASSAPTDARASELWRELLMLKGDGLRSRLRALSPIHARLALHGAAPIIADDGVVDRLAVLLELHAPLLKCRAPAAWIGFVITDGDVRLRDGASAYVELNRTAIADPALAADPRPLSALLADYRHGNTPFDQWWASARIEPWRHHAVERAFIRRIMLTENADVLLERESVGTIDRWLSSALIEVERVEWHQRYVSQSNPTRWLPANVILERILTRYRPPGDGHSFWDDIADIRRRAFERWLRDRELTSLLGEGERVEFWRRFLSDVSRSMESVDGAAVFIVFPRFLAVQFKESGKATYMLGRGHLYALRRLGSSQLYRYVLEHEALGRYTHHGGYWQAGAVAEVERLLSAEDEP